MDDVEERLRIGLIVPPRDGSVPPDGIEIYGDRVEFVAVGLGLEEMTIEGYEGVVAGVADRALELAEQGVASLSLMGTSLSFFRGAAFNDKLAETMEDVTGLPSTTMSTGVVKALRTLRSHRLAVATAYVDRVNERLEAFLAEVGFQVAAIDSLQIEAVDEVHLVPVAAIEELAEGVCRSTEDVDALLISCGGLRTLDVVPRLEQQLGIPVVTSSLAGLWDVVGLSGARIGAQGHGRLFEQFPAGDGKADDSRE